MTREEAIKCLIDAKEEFAYFHNHCVAFDMAIEVLKRPEQSPLTDKVCEKTDDTDKLKFVAHKLEQLDEKIQQLEKDVNRLEKDVNRLENSRTIEVRPTYPNITSTGISAYAGPQFGGVSYDLQTNSVSNIWE